MKPLDQKVAIITGSGRGIGAQTALELSRLGASVVINDLNLENAKLVAQLIVDQGGKAAINGNDVSIRAKATELADFTKATFGRVDILVNNAGITRDGMLHKLSEEQWDDVIRVNLKGPFNMTQACVKYMIENKFGRIVNLASVAWLGNIGQTNYSATKAGVVGMTRTWALELARHGITCNAVAPGFIDTAMTAAVPDEIKAKFVEKIPFKRMGKPEDIANMIGFFTLPASGYVTGQVIQVDGGLTVGVGS